MVPEDNILTISDFINNKLNNIKKNINEYPDCYEYCFNTSYHEKYDEFQLHSIQLGDVFPILLEIDNRIILVAIKFYKNSFNLEQVLTWLDDCKVYIGRPGRDNYKINKCSTVSKVRKFKGHLVATYYKGNQAVELPAGNIKEITKNYRYSYQKMNIWKAKDRQSGVTVLLNGHYLQGIPKIEFIKSKDLIISNGNCIMADYIDVYKGGLGFFNQEDSLNPVAFLLDNSIVEIQITERNNGGKICVVKSKYYVIAIEKL
ncbi:hypothetical protein [Sporotomaculum syntrophicum]|nr:hypothetical protein [Sporotomaculum syntrophicum]